MTKKRRETASAHREKPQMAHGIKRQRLVSHVSQSCTAILRRARRNRAQGRAGAGGAGAEGEPRCLLAGSSSSNGAVPEPVLACFAYSIVKALRYIHNNQKVHRDLKPANVLLAPDGLVKVCVRACGLCLLQASG